MKQFSIVILIAIWITTVLTHLKVSDIRAQFDPQDNIEWLYEVVVTAVIDGKPCEWEVWTVAEVDGEIVEDTYRIVHTQDECWNISDYYLNRLDSLDKVKKW